MPTPRPRAALAVVLALAAGAAQAQPLALQTVATGLSRPLYVTHAPGDTGRLFIVEQRGSQNDFNRADVRIFDFATGQLRSAPFLSIDGVLTGSEQGLLGLAFHPEYETNGYVFVNITISGGGSGGQTEIRRYTRDANDPNRVDPASALTILRIPQPFSNHNGGWMSFGPFDGYLYISSGDGGSSGDPGDRAQDITNQLLGKILRLDVDGADDFPSDATRNYAIPPSNPFVGIVGDDEIWAYGLRNAWRNAFDQQTGDLYLADVGQGEQEEVSFEPFGSTGGENYGWRCYEGNLPFNTTGCPPAGELVFPFQTYDRGGTPFKCSITGGEVYRGCAIPELSGTYFYADYCSGQVWSLRYDGSGVIDFQERTGELSPGGNIVSFGRDAFGEIYICTQQGGVYKIVPASGIDDCNANGIDDKCEVAFGLAEDCDGGPLGNPVLGGEIFATNCASCHAADGTGQFGPNIRNTTRDRLSQFAGASTFHPGGQFTELGAEEFAHIESFLSDTGSKGRPDGIPDECQTLDDCNDNGRADGCDLADGTATDMDFDGILDECQGCSPADVTTTGTSNGTPDGVVDISDFSFYLTLWASADPAADLTTTGSTNGVPDGAVDVSDYSYYLTLWAAGCP